MIKKNEIVIDCCVTMAWILLDDQEEKATAILNMLESKRAKVPTIWPLEVANVLYQYERTKKLTAVETAEFKEFLSALPISVDNTTSLHAMGSIYELAKSESLSIYDAAYLEIALRENLPLGTFDKALKSAAKRVGVDLI